MPIILEQQYDISVGSTENISVNFSPVLDSAEVLSSVVVAEITTAALTISNEAVNTATYSESISCDTVGIGKALQFTVTTSTAGLYQIRLTAVTDSTPARTIVYDMYLRFI